MRPKSWIVIGIILFVIMTLNNLLVIANTGPELDMALAELWEIRNFEGALLIFCLLYTSPSPRDVEESRMPSSA